MTTRIRRTKPQQATDILKALLKEQEVQVAKDQARLEVSLAKAAKTRGALESLQPSLDVAIVPDVTNAASTGGILLNSMAISAGNIVPMPTPLATGIDDVWSAKDGSSTRVHSRLMYERQDRCQLCKEGIPFAAQTRRAHYVLTKDKDAAEGGFSYKFSYEPCKGVA